jgi:2-polyprenyl-3-methyl-5-hydroxy-6-metoxy-1,4-benzoquinol methylase
MLTHDQIQTIAKRSQNRYDYYYIKSKLKTDPIYPSVHTALHGSPHPILDIGCGLGLFTHYLRSHNDHTPIHGFDYDPRKIRSAQAMAAKIPNHQDLHFTHGDARTQLPTFSGNVLILDILQFFTPSEQQHLLTQAAHRVAPDGKLIIRSCLSQPNWRYRLTILGDYFAKATFWMKSAPIHYPDTQLFTTHLPPLGFTVQITPLWGKTPFNNHLIIAKKNHNPA